MVTTPRVGMASITARHSLYTHKKMNSPRTASLGVANADVFTSPSVPKQPNVLKTVAASALSAFAHGKFKFFPAVGEETFPL